MSGDHLLREEERKNEHINVVESTGITLAEEELNGEDLVRFGTSSPRFSPGKRNEKAGTITDLKDDESKDENVKKDNSICSSGSNNDNSIKQVNMSHMLQVMKERLNVSPENAGLRNYLLNSSWLSYSNSENDDSLSDLSVSTGDGFEEFYKHYRSNEIQKELKLVTTHHQDGVYVMPSLKSIEMWFGVMFIRDGPYKDGIFHFTVYFSDDYPDARPTLSFKSHVFHPQIKAKKGTLNLNPAYEKAKENHVHVWELIKYARSCFYHLNVKEAYNPEAAEIFETDLKTFKARCRSSVLDSLLEYEEQKHAFDYQSENPFRSSIIEDDLCDAIKKALVCSERAYDGKHGLFGWAKSQLGKVLNNINAYSSPSECSEKRLSEEGAEQII